MKWTDVVTILLRFCEMVALIGIFLAAYQIAQAAHQTQIEIAQTTASINLTLSRAQSALTAVQSTTESLPAIIDRHLTTLETSFQYQTSMTRLDLNRQLDMTRQSITAEITPITRNAADTLKSTTEIIDQTRLTLIPALVSIQKSSDDFPALVHDLRFTAARSARTMGHVEQMSDAIARATPAWTSTTTHTSTEISGIATDIHKFTTSVVGPKPWYKRAWAFVQAGAGVGRYVF